jgi:hypothetical protein
LVDIKNTHLYFRKPPEVTMTSESTSKTSKFN